MNYKVRLLIATVSILLLTMIAIGCEERDVANISDNSTLPNMTGKITAINNDGRFLVVSPDKFLDQGSKKMPDASWYKMLDNAIIEYKGKTINAENVKIGSTVKVWSKDMLHSYPGQTGGTRLEITAIDSGKGDARGRVTGIEKIGEGLNESWFINVDGVKYRLLEFTQVWKKEARSNVSEIKVGNQIKIWFAGYDLGAEKMVTQVVIY